MSILNLSCDLLEPDYKYINCDWFQYAEKDIYDCEDVTWCNNLTYGSKKVRRAYIFYNIQKPRVDNKFFAGDVDVVLYESMKTACIEYNVNENEIGFSTEDYVYIGSVDVSDRLIAYKSSN